MNIKTNVKFLDNGHLLVDVPYKNGMVTWALNFHNNKLDWILFAKPDNYSPDRVVSAHKNILNGKKLRAKMIAKSAATHKYNILDKLRDVKR